MGIGIGIDDGMGMDHGNRQWEWTLEWELVWE